MLQRVHSENTMLYTRIFELDKSFNVGNEAMKGNSRYIRPSICKTDDQVELMWQVMLGNCRLTKKNGYSPGHKNDSLRNIITEDLSMKKMHKISAKVIRRSAACR